MRQWKPCAPAVAHQRTLDGVGGISSSEKPSALTWASMSRMRSGPGRPWKNSKSFVTLGSPIDKFLMLWWLNYRYLLKSCVWCELSRAEKISHFNYCDDLDPVGHNLDVARRTNAYKAVFESEEDIVFSRYRVPGAAHNEYWGDQDLFKWILTRAVDATTINDRPAWFKYDAYRKVLNRIYNWVPRAVVAPTFFTVSVAH